MSDTDTFLRLAFAQSPAAEANAAMARIREEQGDAKSYEFVLPDKEVRAFLLERTLPRLVDYLESVGARLPGCGGVFLSVFAGDTLHFLHARDAVSLLSEWSGLSLDELKRRYGPNRT
ncbi:STAUR_1299 family protein [Hyalangium rubrum]|uniref:STAUR_1299 family protein n=1 Tax=Hyalangium rubrum TaxID=3103134 RepID=A0ABU5H2L4_9BACT|nr:STAUR_1299 family protein [Hyalangium sp. s54d21]MDY7227349.1 STAUR_1299 family protein [Hyalangium sp. s54d21]